MKKNERRSSFLILTCAVLIFSLFSMQSFASTGNNLTVTKPAGDTFYVCPQGDNMNPGTEKRPWKTIQKAADSVKPGDVVYIRKGIYKERVNLTKSGAEGKYVTFANYPGESVVIDGTGITWGYDWGCLFNLNGQNYIKVSGLRIINSIWAGIGYAPDSKGCENIIIQNCSTYNTKSSGIAFFTGSNIIIDNNSVELACSRTDGSQENISVCGVHNFEVKNNHVFNCTNNVGGGGGEGISIKNGCSNGKIYNNSVNNLNKVGIYIDAYSTYQYNIEVYGNTIYNNTDGISLASERGATLENIYIHDNTVYHCRNWGYIISAWGWKGAHPMKNIVLSNNTTAYLGDGGIYLNNPYAEDVIIKNNVFKSGGVYTPIYLNGGNLAETSIDGNTLNRIVAGQPTGTDYCLY